MLETLALVAIFIAFFYFMAVRPMRKQAAAAAQMRDSLEVGSRVMLTSGIYGNIRHLADRQAIVELAPGLEVTVTKSAIASVVTPDEEDFEYEDALEPEPSLEQPAPILAGEAETTEAAETRTTTDTHIHSTTDTKGL